MTASATDEPDKRLVRALQIARELKAELDRRDRIAREPIAVVGVACRLPGGAVTPDRFWRLLVDGVDAVGPAPEGRFAQGPTRPGGWLDDVESFDHVAFGMSPRETRTTDPQQRMFLEVAVEALENSGSLIEQVKGSQTGVFVGANATDHLQLHLAQPSAIDMHTVVGNANSIIANRVSYALDLHGPSLVLDSACSSSLVGAHLAMRSLRSGEVERAIVGGVNLILSPQLALAHSRGLPVSPDGRCRTFDAHADGYARGEGVVALVLRRLSDAVAYGERIWAVLHGSAVNQDGLTNGIAAPNGRMQRRVIEQAVQAAGVDPARITYIEAHGTGTELGDPIEVEALAGTYGMADGPECLLGSVKSNIGHLEAAAGAAGLLKATLSVAYGVVPATINFRELNPNIELDGTRLAVAVDARPQDGLPDEHRLAGVSAFGAGGTNAHIVLGPGPGPEVPDAPVPAASTVLAVSAHDAAGLREAVADLRGLLDAPVNRTVPLAAYSAALSRSRASCAHRLAVVARDHDEAVARLDSWLDGDSPPGVVEGVADEAVSRGTVFVVPGQGAQRAAMCLGLREISHAFRTAVESVDSVMAEHLDGRSILVEIEQLGEDAPVDVVQPALFTIAVGLSARLGELGVTPDAVMGHSMGEIAAAHLAGCLDLASAVRLVCTRSRLLRQVSHQGAMLAVGLDGAAAAELIAGVSDRVSVAVLNGPRSSVLSGDADVLEGLAQQLRRRNVFARRVPVEVASHSPHMDVFAQSLVQELAGITAREGGVPMLSTVTGEQITAGELTPEYWYRNLREPVRFWDGVQTFAGLNYTSFVELSPHPLLTAAVSQGLGDNGVAVAAAHRDLADDAIGLAFLARSWAVGRAPRWPDAATEAPAGVTAPLPPRQWRRTRFLLLRPEPSAAAMTPEHIADPVKAVAATSAAPELRDPEKLERLVLDCVASALGCTRDDVDPESGFFQLGMDSRLTNSVRQRIVRATGLDLPGTVMFEFPTAQSLLTYLATRLAPPTDAPSVASVAAPAVVAAAPAPRDDDLTGLSRDELFRLLSAELTALPANAAPARHDAIRSEGDR